MPRCRYREKSKALYGHALRHCEARSSPDNQLEPWIASSFLLAMTLSGSGGEAQRDSPAGNGDHSIIETRRQVVFTVREAYLPPLFTKRRFLRSREAGNQHASLCVMASEARPSRQSAQTLDCFVVPSRNDAKRQWERSPIGAQDIKQVVKHSGTPATHAAAIDPMLPHMSAQG